MKVMQLIRLVVTFTMGYTHLVNLETAHLCSYFSLLSLALYSPSCYAKRSLQHEGSCYEWTYGRPRRRGGGLWFLLYGCSLFLCWFNVWNSPKNESQRVFFLKHLPKCQKVKWRESEEMRRQTCGKGILVEYWRRRTDSRSLVSLPASVQRKWMWCAEGLSSTATQVRCQRRNKALVRGFCQGNTRHPSKRGWCRYFWGPHLEFLSVSF